MDTGAFQNRTTRTTSYNTCTGSCGLQEYNTSGFFTRNRVRNCSLDARNAESVLLCFLDTLSNCRGNFLRLAVADTNGTVAVANNYESSEAKPASRSEERRVGKERNGEGPGRTKKKEREEHGAA